MKKNSISLSLVSLTTIYLFSGCSFNNDNNTSVNLVTKDKDVVNEINNLKNGVKFSIEVEQNLRFLDKYHGEYTGKKENHKITAEIVYQGGELNAFSLKVVDSYLDGFVYDRVNMISYEGEDGASYYKMLNYDNKIETYADIYNGIPVNYNYYCANPFSFLSLEDFSKTADSTYSLSKSKSSFFAVNVLGDIDDAFLSVIDECEFRFEGKDLKSIRIVPHPTHRQRTVKQDNHYYMLEQEVILNVDEKGSSVKVNDAKPNNPSDTTEIAKLQNALNKLKNNNYTLDLETDFKESIMEVVEDGEEKEYNNYNLYATYFYTGTDLYFSSRSEKELPEKPNADNDMLLFDVGKEKLSAYGYSEAESVDNPVFTKAAGANFNQIDNAVTYDQINPKLNEVDANIFNYNKEKNCFSICEEMKQYIASIAIVPPLSTISQYLDKFGTGMDVYLTEDGNIDYVEFSFLFHNGFEYLESKSILRFSNIGTTVLPYNLIVK